MGENQGKVETMMKFHFTPQVVVFRKAQTQDFILFPTGFPEAHRRSSFSGTFLWVSWLGS